MSWKKYLGIGIGLITTYIGYSTANALTRPLPPKDLNEDGIPDIAYEQGFFRTKKIYFQDKDGNLTSLKDIEKRQEKDLKEKHQEEIKRFRESRKRSFEKMLGELIPETKNTSQVKK